MEIIPEIILMNDIFSKKEIVFEKLGDKLY